MGARATGHGVTEREAEILARIDDGQTERDIAAAMGLTPGYVRSMASYYNSGLDGRHSERLVRKAAEISNASFIAALSRTGGRFL
jgi:DNA-binding NarL/FixJ family response regulator